MAGMTQAREKDAASVHGYTRVINQDAASEQGAGGGCSVCVRVGQWGGCGGYVRVHYEQAVWTP